MRVIGLLAGIGTLLWEAREHGLKVVGNLETRGPYHTGRQYSWDLNFDSVPLLRRPNELDDAWMQPDLVLGHPPCGSHSTLGNSGARTDSMNDETRRKFFADRDADMGLLPLFIEQVNALQPRSFALDNLPKILKTSAPPEWWQTMLPKYHLTFVIMKNWDYGTPQRRERLWVIGIRKPGKSFVFVPPKKRLAGPKTMLEAFGLEPFQGSDHPTPLGWEPWSNLAHLGHVHVEPNVMLTADYRTTIKGFRITKAAQLGLGFLSIPPNRPWPYTTDLGRLANKIGRLRPDAAKHAPVVTGLPSIHHPYTGWPLTPRERARLMDWPDDFHLGNESTLYDRTAMMRLILFTGKAVPSGFPRYLIPQLVTHLKRRG